MRQPEPLFEAIAARKAELDAQRPLAPGSIRQLDAWYDVELTYTSNAIEGNTLTRSETAIVLEKGLTVRGKPLRDHLEAIDHRDALDYVRHIAGRDERLGERHVREIHALVLGRSQRGEAGRYATVARAVLGSSVRFPGPHEVPALMGDFGRWLGMASPTPQAAFEAHYRLVSIHPFADGNGRTARLLMNLLLFRGGYPPVAIAPEHRPDYIDALETRQLSGTRAPYDRLMAERLLASLDAYLSVVADELRGSGA